MNRVRRGERRASWPMEAEGAEGISVDEAGAASASAAGRALLEHEVARDPLAQLRAWLEEGVRQCPGEPVAMALATASPDGIPAARMVLLKGADATGIVFYTNYESDKARDLAVNPRAALLFYWPDLGRQVRVTGRVTLVSAAETAAYFASRARASRLGAWASAQSRVIGSRSDLEARLVEVEERFAGVEVPPPPHWGGYRVVPASFEFWLGRADRLHDRLRYRRDAAGEWAIERLSP